jgi:hypothetical protein
MTATLWFIIVGVLLVAMAVSGSVVKRLPLTTSLLYLVAGVALGPRGADLVSLDPLRDAAFLERLTEIAVLISLFTQRPSSLALRSTARARSAGWRRGSASAESGRCITCCSRSSTPCRRR